MVRITPLGLDPKTCDHCEEWEGASKKLASVSRRHSRCVEALRMIRESNDLREISIIIDSTLGPEK